MEWNERIRENFVDNLKSIELNKISKEMTKCIDSLGGNDELNDTVEMLFSYIKEDIRCSNKQRFRQILNSLEKQFRNIIKEFKKYCKFEEVEYIHKDHVYYLIWQYIRFFDFVERIKKFDKNKARTKTYLFDEMKNSFNEIGRFIFSVDPWQKPREIRNYRIKPWAGHFEDFIYFTRSPKFGLEAYYAKGLGEILRTIRNYHEHSKTFQFYDKDIQDNFHTGFIQIYSIYVLACFSFLELLKYWERNKEFLDQLLEGEIS